MVSLRLALLAALSLASPAWAQSHDHHGHGAPPDDVVLADVVQHGAIGAPGMNREASGTSWQPDTSEHGGLHVMADGWMLMGHATLNGVFTDQGGPRGADKAFGAGMVMGSARRDFSGGRAVQFRAMLSPDPFMGKRGYPLLLAAGETANGVDHLVDRQHPHDLFMELSASLSQRLNTSGAVFIYAGLPGEPAFGPPVFMHRQSGMDAPEAPISHHWFDSTHITFGVVTAGYVQGDWKFEASRFRGREPDESRFDIETGALDSTALRASWNPSREWSLQASWADLTSPELLHPEDDETRWSVSAMRTVQFTDGWWATTLAFGQKEHGGEGARDAWLLESAFSLDDRWTIFGRAERIESDELDESLPDAVAVARLSVGVVRDWRVAEHLTFGVGASVSESLVPDELDAAYGGDPRGATAFVRLKLG